METGRRSYVVVCRGPNCRERGALPLRKRLAELLRGDASTALLGYSCFGQCDYGPNVAFFPEAEWYGALTAADAADQVLRHARENAALGHPLQLTAAERNEHLANILELVTTIERDRARRRGRPWWWPF